VEHQQIHSARFGARSGLRQAPLPIDPQHLDGERRQQDYLTPFSEHDESSHRLTVHD